MKPKSGDKGTGDAVESSLHLHVVSSSKNVVIPGTSVMARRSANIQKANDGSLIYRRRHSLPSSASAVTPESKGADVLVQTRSQGKDTSRSRMGLPIEKRSDRKRLAESDVSQSLSAHKRRRTIRNTADGTCVESDAFCWICHRDGLGICCELCPRLYHIKCLGIEQPSREWICPECEKIMVAENTETRSKAMLMLSMDALCTLLKFVLQRMKYPETDPFQRPVDCALIPTYTDFIFNAMDFSTLEKNIKKKAYGSTEAFVADVKWILHNCIVFNGKKHRLTNIAKTILKVCRHETNEIEVCPDCYMNSCVKPSDNWFCQPCRTPHVLVWAKMKGYPFWPAKVLREDKGLIDVRFFGEHDRAWVPVSQIFMMSEEPPTSLKNRKGFEQATEELHRHIVLLREKFGSFTYAPHRTPYDPSNPYSKVNLSVSPQSQPTIFRSKRISKSKRIMKVRNVDETQKGVKIFISKISEKPTSITKKTACAVRLKYNSIISTRMASAKKPESSQAPAPRTVKNMDGLEAGTAVTGEMMMQKEIGADNEDGVTRESDLDGSDFSSATAVELQQGEQIASFPSSKRSISELGMESRDISDLDARANKNLDSTGDITFSCRSEVQSNEPESVKQRIAGSVVLGDNETVAADVATNLSDLSDKDVPLSTNYQNSESVTLPICRETKPISRDEPVFQESPCLFSTNKTDHSHDIIVHSDECRSSDSVRTAVVESIERESALTSSQEASDQPEKTEGGIDPLEDSNGACKSSNNAEEKIGRVLEEPPESNVPNDSLKLVLSSELHSKDGLESKSKKSVEKQPCHIICELEERVTPALEVGFFSSVAELSLSNVSSVKEPLPESSASAANLASPTSVAAISTNSAATAVDGIALVSIKSVSPNQLHALKSAVSVSNEASEIGVDSPGPDFIEKNPSAKSGINAVTMDCPSDISAGLDSSIPKSLASEVEERASKLADSSAGASPLMTVQTETAPSTALVSLSPAADGKAKLSSDSVAAGQQTKMPARAVCSSNPLPESSADDLLMEVDCEDEASVVVIDDEVEQLCGSTTVLIKDVKSLQPTKNIREILETKNSKETTVMGATVDTVAGSLGQTVPLLQHLTQPSIRSPYLATVLSKTQTLTTPAKLPCFPMRNLVLAVSGTVTPNSGTAISSQLSAPGPAALCHSQLLNAGISCSGTSANSAAAANVATASEFNIEGFDYSKYTNKIIESTKNMLKEFCQDMMNAEVGSAIRKHLQLELDRVRWRHEQMLNEIKHNAAIQLAELRFALEHDKEFSLTELRQKLEEEKKKEIDDVKKKQWCANCGKEAIFYCCWNTSYCNYPCQQAHWPKHMHTCTQAPESSQSRDEQATASQSDDRGTANVPSNQQQKWKDNPDLSINAALKQQELDRQLRLTFSMNASGHQYLSNQPHALPSIQIASASNHHIGVHNQQPTPPVVQVQYSTAAPYNNSSIHMTSYLSSGQQPASIHHPQQQQFRLRANLLQQQQQHHQPGIIMYPGVPTAVLTTHHGNQTIPTGSIQPGPIYQPKKY